MLHNYDCNHCTEERYGLLDQPVPKGYFHDIAFDFPVKPILTACVSLNPGGQQPGLYIWAVRVKMFSSLKFLNLKTPQYIMHYSSAHSHPWAEARRVCTPEKSTRLHIPPRAIKLGRESQWVWAGRLRPRLAARALFMMAAVCGMSRNAGRVRRVSALSAESKQNIHIHSNKQPRHWPLTLSWLLCNFSCYSTCGPPQPPSSGCYAVQSVSTVMCSLSCLWLTLLSARLALLAFTMTVHNKALYMIDINQI